MKHRSFRLSRSSSRPSVSLAVRLLHLATHFLYLVMLSIVVALAMIVGANTSFFANGQPNWFVLLAFAVIVSLTFEFVRLQASVVSKSILQRHGRRWMTDEQLRRFPGLFERFPDDF